MAKDTDSSSSSGIGVLGLLGIVFVVLKLTNYIDWSWWYVTMPFWGGFALVLLISLIWIFCIVARDTGEASK